MRVDERPGWACIASSISASCAGTRDASSNGNSVQGEEGVPRELRREAERAGGIEVRRPVDEGRHAAGPRDRERISSAGSASALVARAPPGTSRARPCSIVRGRYRVPLGLRTVTTRPRAPARHLGRAGLPGFASWSSTTIE